MTLTAVPGVRVGHWTDRAAGTGCTVIVFPEPNVSAVEIRGAAPGSRETALLAPGMRVEQIQAILLTGGSAFGLAAADGVMAGLEAEGRGHPTPAGPVPIVPAAVVFDLMVGDRMVRPGAAEGLTAFEKATSDPVVAGRWGAGAGATVAKWRGFDQPGGLGSFSVVAAGATVGALAVLNAVGDVFSLEGESLTGGDLVPGPPVVPPMPGTNTTLVVVATDARLSRVELGRLALRSQDALAVCLRPAHTRYDGDTSFAISCGEVEANLDVLSEAAFHVTGRAIETAVRAAAAKG